MTIGVQIDDKDPVEIKCLERTMDDVVLGYIPNNSYDPVQMENDEEFPKVLIWSYSDVILDTPDTAYSHYNGDGPCLKKYIHNMFSTLLGACGTTESFNYDLMEMIIMNSNAYVCA